MVSAQSDMAKASVDMIGKLKLDGWQLYYESMHVEAQAGGHAWKCKACGDKTGNWYEVFEHITTKNHRHRGCTSGVILIV